MIFKGRKGGGGVLQRCRLRLVAMSRDMHKTGLYRSAGEWIPLLAGGTLTLFLFWSFFVSPIYSNAVDALKEGDVGKALKQGAMHPLSLFTKLQGSEEHGQEQQQPQQAQEQIKRQNYGGGHSAEDFIPERTDLEWLLNKSASIDPLINQSFALGSRVDNWDEQRSVWLQEHADSSQRVKILMVTGSQPQPCLNLMGDHMLLRALKNKVDYARTHSLELFYNVATFTSELPSWWVKLPLLRSIMLSRPDVEWLWWVDSDAVFTDMSFAFPHDKYDGYNFVIHGWESLVYGERKWTGLNMGIFLVRNCQWTLDLFDTLAPMGQKGEVGDRIGKILTMSLSGRPESFESDDQGAFIWLLNAERDKWGSKVYLENSYYLNGYWKDIVGRFEELQASSKPGFGDERWPLVTHFTGCQICSGRINAVYTAEECRSQMERALHLADDQVLDTLGYGHTSLSSPEIARIHKNS